MQLAAMRAEQTASRTRRRSRVYEDRAHEGVAGPGIRHPVRLAGRGSSGSGWAWRWSVLLSALALWPGISTAEKDQSLVDDFSESVLQGSDNQYINITNENDLYGSGRDQNYTNGMRISWFPAGREPPGITEDLEHVLPFLDVNETTSVVYSLGHNVYTPDDIESAALDPDDRPWAAFLYGSMGMVTVSETFLDEYEITLGIVGPAAQGELLQKTVHKVINSPEPKGWDNQLDNEPGLMLSWQRRWPGFLQGDIIGTQLSMAPHFGLTGGNIYTYANAGATLNLSSEGRRWADKPLFVRPSIPGIGFFPRAANFSWDLFFAFEGRAIARNIFLDGNTFSDSHSVDRKDLVGDISTGIAMTWRGIRLGYTLVYRTKEFDGQDDAELFGAINIGFIL